MALWALAPVWQAPTTSISELTRQYRLIQGLSKGRKASTRPAQAELEFTAESEA